MPLLMAFVVGSIVFRLVWWLGGIWIAGAEALDDRPD